MSALRAEVQLKLALQADPSFSMPLVSAVIHQKQGLFQWTQARRFNLGRGSSAHWAFVELQNVEPKEQQVVLQISASMVEKLELYDLNHPEVPVKNLRPIQTISNPTRTQYPTFEFLIPANQRRRYMLRIQDHSSMPIEFRLLTPEELAQRNSLENLLYGVFYGVLCFAGIASLFGYFLFREVNFIAYFLMTLTQGLTLLVMDGLFRYFILPSYPSAFYDEVFSSLVQFSLLSTLLFSYRFLNLPGKNKFCSLLFKILGLLIGLNFVFSVFGNFDASTTRSALLCGLSFFLIFVVSLAGVKWHVNGAKMFLAAFLIVELSSITLAVQYLGFDLNFTSYSTVLRIGVGVEVGVLLLAVMLRMQTLSRAYEENRERLSQKNLDHAQKISEKNLELTRLDRLKDEFLANTTHELNTPLFGMLGLTESLLTSAEDRLTVKERQNLSLTLSMGKRLTHLIHDILDFSSLKNNQLALDIKPVDLVALSKLVIRLIEPLTSTKNLNLQFQCDDHLPWILADENRMQQILFNLLGNAVKFTHEGDVILKLQEMPDSVSIEVKDTGIGIANKQWGQLFEPFVREHPEVISEMGGSGLGLSITLKLIELQGGRLEMMSQPGRGTSFSFSLPLSKTQRSETVTQFVPILTEPQPPPTSPIKAKILVIDDEPGNIAMLQDLLTRNGYQVSTAPGGLEGLELLENEQPDLLLLDLMMPLINGYEVCQEVRRLFSPDELPILILTAQAQAGKLEEAFKAGANDYITKPILGKELLARLDLHLKIKDSPTLDGRISLLEETQKELSETHAAVLRLIERSPEPLLLLDEEFRVLTFNHATKRVFPELNDPDLDCFFKNPATVMRAAQNPKRQNPIAYAKLKGIDGEASMAPLANGHWMIGFKPASLQPTLDSVEFRKTLVGLSRLALDYWTTASGKTKFELAEKSGIWRVYNDEGRLRTRILDKYCNLKSLPKNPRYMDVIRTAHFVLAEYPEGSGLKEDLLKELEKVQTWV